MVLCRLNRTHLYVFRMSICCVVWLCFSLTRLGHNPWTLVLSWSFFAIQDKESGPRESTRLVGFFLYPETKYFRIFFISHKVDMD